MGEWVTKRLAEVVELRRGFDLPTRLRRDGPYPVLSAGITAGWHNEGPVKGPGFVIGRATNLGQPTWSEGDFWPLNTTLYAADCRGNSPRFLFHLFEVLDLRGFDSGSVQPMLNRNYISDVEVKLPDFATQRAIADVLGALDDKIAANERVARTAFELAHSMVLCLLNSAGDELVSTKFGALGELFDGPHATPTRRSDGPYFLNISSLKSGRLDLAESDHVSEEDFSKWTRRVVPQAGDLLFSYETRIGEAALMPDGVRACLGRRMALLRPDRTRVDPVFLLHFYLAPAFQRIIATHTIHGATVPRIGLATMPNWDIEIPTFEAQQAIAGALGALHQGMVQSERESDQLATVRDELLPLLMSGKVRVKEAEAVVSEVL